MARGELSPAERAAEVLETEERLRGVAMRGAERKNAPGRGVGDEHNATGNVFVTR